MSKCTECNLGPCGPRDRKCEGLDEELGRIEGQASFGSPTGDISFEGERDRVLEIQTTLDGQVQAENIFPEDPESVTSRGLPPCKRAKRQG